MKEIKLTQNKVTYVDDKDYDEKTTELFGQYAHLNIPLNQETNHDSRPKQSH